MLRRRPFSLEKPAYVLHKWPGRYEPVLETVQGQRGLAGLFEPEEAAGVGTKEARQSHVCLPASVPGHG